jgi:hypothetical protein
MNLDIDIGTDTDTLMVAKQYISANFIRNPKKVRVRFQGHMRSIRAKKTEAENLILLSLKDLSICNTGKIVGYCPFENYPF